MPRSRSICSTVTWPPRSIFLAVKVEVEKVKTMSGCTYCRIISGGCRLRGQDNRAIDLSRPASTTPKQRLCLRPEPTFVDSAKIIRRLDFPRQSIARQFTHDELAQPELKPCHRVTMDSKKLINHPRRGLSAKQLPKDDLLART